MTETQFSTVIRIKKAGASTQTIFNFQIFGWLTATHRQLLPQGVLPSAQRAGIMATCTEGTTIPRNDERCDLQDLMHGLQRVLRGTVF